MARIPFDIKYRDKIESGEYKVETRYGCSARIVCWDRAPKENSPKDLNLCVLIKQNGGESIYYYHTDGTKWVKEECFDLFIVTPEPEMSEFEMKVSEFAEAYELAATDYKSEEYKTCNGNLQLIIDKYAAELLSLAKSQLLQSGELLTQEHHEKLMETQYKETLDGVKKNWHDYFTPQAVTDIYNAGRNDILKDMPRWRNVEADKRHVGCVTRYMDVNGDWNYCMSSGMLSNDCQYISIAALEKLPQEDESYE